MPFLSASSNLASQRYPARFLLEFDGEVYNLALVPDKQDVCRPPGDKQRIPAVMGDRKLSKLPLGRSSPFITFAEILVEDNGVNTVILSRENPVSTPSRQHRARRGPGARRDQSDRALENG
jgi:hypothetical protein